MSKLLNDLHPLFKLKCIEFLARLVEADIPVKIIETLRSEEKHLADLASGHSWIKHSLHQDGLAIDICPYNQFTLRGTNKLQWDANDPVWERVALLAEGLGLVSGYRWKQKDCGHIQNGN